MNEKIIEFAATQGIWALLSVALLFYILKTQEKRDSMQEEREKNYQLIIANLSEKFNFFESIKEDISEIKNILMK